MPPYDHTIAAAVNDSDPDKRTLHIYFEGLLHRKMHILDSDKVTELYTSEQNSGGLFSEKPHIKVFNASSKSQIGDITYHAFSRQIDTTIHSKDVRLESAGFFTVAHSFEVSSGSTVIWKKDRAFSHGDMLCVDEAIKDTARGTLAKFNWNHLSTSKSGTLELVPVVSGVLLDEVVVTFLAMYEFLRRRRRHHGGGGAGGP